ncbi:hypothetical protein HIM_11137 [Hirsutella minnesotensis 3608]|uniref:Uncharacterized protein n=1 Tax=Hirsutella minnesotensis 3608 TaxID=1043627 RepID=A0A0F7ZJB0_9HYPO|nr:hypothetical protein HIM_11137 [Hirsutella minnesotensis 3608]
MEGNASKPGAEGGRGAVWETLKTMDCDRPKACKGNGRNGPTRYQSGPTGRGSLKSQHPP